jgi:23S rRNA (cytosine1962-C5)-methyltransferase
VHAHALIPEKNSLRRGDVVDLVDVDGGFLGRGLINPDSKLRVRLYAFDPQQPLDDQFWRDRIDAAIARRRLIAGQSDGGSATDQQAERLIFSESDLLSGLIVDRYADTLSVQFTAGGLLKWRDVILDHLRSVCGARQIVVRVDEKTAALENIDAETASQVIPEALLEGEVVYQQNGLQLAVDLLGGQKTGGYLDQRLNHLAAAEHCHGKRVLDVCCYTGGFGLVAAKHGAESVLGVDSSASALESAQQNAQRNDLSQLEFRQGDCFDVLKEMADQNQQFDVVVLDPPRFAGSRHQVRQALRAYSRLNSLAMRLLPPGGLLVTCSCSGRVSRADFLNMLVDVGKRTRRDLIVLENRGPAPDHPLAVSCPESDYLKCVIAQAQ